ncbi:hypothetical protein AAE478_000679 [Parahypoxylon ruwenzoriense]
MSLFDDIFSGTLTATNLKNYLKDTDIDALHPQKKVTPLIAAVFAGHANIVEQLLEIGHADANVPSADGQSPLCWAAVATRRDRAKIVDLLLKHKADVDGTCDALRGETPLMLVMKESRDLDTIRLLVEAGASFSAINKKGETVEDIARKLNSPVMDAALHPTQRSLDVAEVTKMIVGVIGIIIAWVNSQTLNNIVRGVTKEMSKVIEKIYDISGERNEELEKKIWDKEPRTPAEFRESINTFVTKTGLDDFFSGKNARFLQTVAEKATELLKDPMDPMSKPENVKKLIRVSLYQVVIYCDDSGSMMGQRAKAQAALVERIARVATRLLPDDEGVELRFINANGSNLSGLRDADVKARMEELQIKKGMYTEIGTGLKEKILQPLVYDLLQASPKRDLKRPLLVCMITDGQPQSPPRSESSSRGQHTSTETYETTKNVIYQCGNILDDNEYSRTSVLFQINQIGNDTNAEEFLKSLAEEERIKDQTHIATGKPHKVVRSKDQVITTVFQINLTTSGPICEIISSIWKNGSSTSC